MRKTFIDLDSDSEDEYKEVFLRIYVVGSPKSGKTSFIHRLLYNRFSISYVPTRAVEIYNKKTFVRYGLKMTLEMIDVPDGFLIKPKPNDIMVVVYNKIECNTVQYNTLQIQCNTIQYNTTPYNTIQHNTIQYNTIE